MGTSRWRGASAVSTWGARCVHSCCARRAVLSWGWGFGEPDSCGHLKPVLVIRPPCATADGSQLQELSKVEGAGGSPSPIPLGCLEGEG